MKGKYVGLEILAPAPCFLEKLKNQFRYQLVLKSKKSSDPNGSNLHNFVYMNFKNKKSLGNNKIDIYFDPISLI